MIGIAALAATLLGLAPAKAYSAGTPIQFYYTDNSDGSVELWTSDGGYWNSVPNPGKKMLIPSDAENRKAVDVYIRPSTPPLVLARYPIEPGYTLSNPVLFLEGMDFYDEVPPDPNHKRKDLTAENLYDSLVHVGIAGELDARGHDILTLNYQHSTIDIRRNGEFVAQVISWISSQLSSGSSAPMVAGVSMGAVVGRWAIHRYETGLRTASQPRVSLFLSLDGPHQGANIPISVKYLVKGLGEFNGGDGQVLNAALNYSTASKQLLLRLDQNGPAQEFAPFQTQYAASRSLPGTRQVAFTNGSLVGAPQEYLPGDGFSDQATQLAFRKDPAKLWTPLSSALAGTTAFSISRMAEETWLYTTAASLILNGGVDQADPTYFYNLYQSDILSGLTIRGRGSWTAQIPYDLAPGGFLPVFSMIYSQVNANLDKAIRDNDLSTVRDERSLEVGHACFIPTVSAVDYLRPDGTAAIQDNAFVFANLKALDPNIARHTTFDAVYGIDDASFANWSSAREAGFWRNQLHIFGLSEDNTYRLACEVDFVDGRITDPSVCSHAQGQSWYSTRIWRTIDLTGSNGAPAWTNAGMTRSRFTYPSSTDPFVSQHQDAWVWSGYPVAGWNPVLSLPYMLQANDVVSVDVYVPPADYGYLSMNGVLANAEDGCGYYQFPEIRLNTAQGGWQHLSWTVPGWYDPQCSSSGGVRSKSGFKMILNANAVRGALMTTGLTVVRNGGSLPTLPPLIPSKAQVVPLRPGSKFALGDWGTHDGSYGASADLNVVLDAPWTGAVLYNKAGLDVSAYTYLEVEAKGSVVASKSRMMIFFDDHPQVTPTALDEGFISVANAVLNPYGKDYNYWSTMELVSRSADGFETRRVPITWLTSTGTMSKILIQHATWNGTPNETWEIRSMKFTN